MKDGTMRYLRIEVKIMKILNCIQWVLTIILAVFLTIGNTNGFSEGAMCFISASLIFVFAQSVVCSFFCWG